MTDEIGVDPELIADGHKLHFRLARDQVVVSRVECPNHSTVSLCNRRREYCAVDKFIEVYGMECNIGSTDITGPVEIAWLGLGGGSDIDYEFAQIWIIPVDDEQYKTLNTEV